MPSHLTRRRRPDRDALAEGEMASAGAEKYRLEEMQRAEKRQREAEAKPWVPRWFKKVEEPELLPGPAGAVLAVAVAVDVIAAVLNMRRPSVTSWFQEW